MGLERIEEFTKQRRWSRVTEEIKSICKRREADQALYAHLSSLAKELFPRMHPISVCDTAVALSQVLETGSSAAILRDALASIEARAKGGSEYADERVLLKMHILLLRTREGQYEETETNIYEWRLVKEQGYENGHYMSEENQHLLERLGYAYYVAIGNVEEAQKCLLRYVEESEDFGEIRRLAELSLLSRTFFDFARVSAFAGFDAIRKESLGRLFLDFQHGGFEDIKRWEGDLHNIIRRNVGEESIAEYMEYVTEKICLINMVYICFKERNKYVPLKTFREVLGVSEAAVIRLVYKLFGHGLVTGWLDTEEGLLMFDRVVPRGLSLDEISEMKSRFAVWRERVQDVINQISE